MVQAYDPVQVAWKVIDIANNNGIRLTHMQLQKLVYIAHGYFLAAFNRQLISEPVTAWKYGPVIPMIYQEFKRFGGAVINPGMTAHSSLLLPPGDEQLLCSVIMAYGHLTGVQLSELTHRQDSPWSKVWYNGGSHRDNAIISDEIIKDQYQRLLSGQNNSCL